MRRLFFLSIGMFAVGGSPYMIAGLLPNISQTLGQPVTIVSQGITAFNLTFLLSAPFFSVVFANKSAKRTLQFALAVFLLGNFLTLASENIVLFILGRIISGLAAGIFSPLCVGVAIQLGDQNAKGKVLSLVLGANSAGVVFGVPVGIYLASKLNWQYSIAYVFILAFVALVGFSLQKIDTSLPTTSSIKDRLRLLVDKKILSVIGISCLTSLASLGLYSYVALVHAESSGTLAVLLFFWGLGGFVGSSFVGHFVDRIKNVRILMAIILIGLLLSIASIPFTINLPYIRSISFFMWGVFGWGTVPPQQHVLFERNERQRTILSALNSSAIGLGNSIGTAGGAVLISSGIRAMQLPFFSASILIGVLIFQFMLIKINKNNYESHEV